VDKSSIKIEILVERYLSACRSAGMSPKTLRGYNEKLQRYCHMVGGCLGDFNLNIVREHLINLQATPKWKDHPFIKKHTEKLSATSIRGHGMVLCGFSTWLYEEGYTDDKMLAKLKLPKPNEISMEPLSDDEISTLLSCFNINKEIGCRNAACTWLFLDTGLRCAEQVALDMDNLFLETRRLKIMGKGRKERI